MKLMTPLVLLFLSVSALAQLPPLDPARQAERDAVYGRPAPYQPGRPLRPPVRPLPPPGRPPLPPPPSYGSADYGPNYTVRWQDYGLNRVPKLLSEGVTINVYGVLVNEMIVRAIGNRVEISSAIAYLSNGQIVDLRQITGTVRENSELRVALDYRYSLRVERIVIQASSPNLIGSRGQLQVLLGLAQ